MNVLEDLKFYQKIVQRESMDEDLVKHIYDSYMH